MDIKESAENYLETIHILRLKQGHVRSIDIANELNFSKPSISIAMKKLREGGYINIDADGYITLTDEGVSVAESIYERHRLLAEFFIGLGVSDETAAKDACKIEHVISQETFEKIKQRGDERKNRKNRQD